MRRSCTVCVFCAAGLLTGCASGGNVTTATPNSGPGLPASSRTFDCDGQWMWGGNFQATTSSSASMFLPAGTITYPRAGHTASLLSDGTVLVVGGGQLDVDDLLVSISFAEIFDPVHGNSLPLKSCGTASEFRAATVLKDGRVLLTGGNEFLGYPTWLAATAAGQIFDPTTHAFTSTPPMTISRTHHTSTLLGDGQVLIAGGSTVVGPGANTTSPPTASTELYDPSSDSFRASANMTVERTAHTATLLPSGKVLVAGGENSQGALASAEIYDPQTNKFVATGSMSTPRTGHTATLLLNGKVLISGGASVSAIVTGGIAVSTIPLATSELYDPESGTFSPASSMTNGRLGHTATLLPDGRVLIAGGFKSYAGRYESFGSAEIYDPSSDSFITAGQMNAARFWHSATALPNGSVLLIGGINEDASQASAEIFEGPK